MRLYKIGPITDRIPDASDDVVWTRVFELVSSVLAYNGDIRGLAQAFGLSGTLALGAREAAKSCFDSHLNLGDLWYDYMVLCLILVQGRQPDITKEEVIARVELEDILMGVLYGKP